VAVATGSPAEKGGILLGDIIVAADGSPIQSVESLQPFLDSEYVGKSISLDMVRGGQRVKLSVTVGEKQRS
jgi:S1-C subfamily serine protease